MTRVSIYQHLLLQADTVKVAARDLRLPRVLLVASESDSMLNGTGEARLIASRLDTEGWPVSLCLPMDGANRSEEFPGYLRLLHRQLTDCDLIHVVCASAGSLARYVLPALMSGRFYGRQVIVQLAGDGMDVVVERYGRFIAPLMRGIGTVVVSSDRLAESLSRLNVPVQRIPSLVDVDGISSRVISSVQPRILSLRPLEPNSNHLCLLKAYALAKQKYPRAELLIAGRGSLRQELERWIERHNIAGVTFAEVSAHEKLLTLLADSDLLVNSASRDDMSAEIMIGMASGLPVVTSRAVAIADLIRDRETGLVAPVNSHTGLADRIIELIENPTLTRALSLASRREAEQYSWTRLRHHWVNLYDRMHRAG